MKVALLGTDFEMKNRYFYFLNISKNEKSCIEAKFVVTRQLGYYIINIFIPTLLGVVLSYMSYWIDPRNSPARICIGVFANLSVNTVATSSSLPRVSYIKAIDVWFFACQVIFGINDDKTCEFSDFDIHLLG